MRKRKSTILDCRALLWGAFLTIALLGVHQRVFSWGFFGHRFINHHAVFLLPPQMYGFYKKHIGYLSDHATDPDKRRYVIAEEGPRHFIDMDKYGSVFPPQQWEEAVARYTTDTLISHGIAPWWIMVMHGRLKKAFIACDAAAILKLSADFGHYIADVHVPLHASSNHNGQQTDQHGIHGFWESRLPEMFAASQYDMLLGRATYIDDPANFIWQRVFESAAAVDTVLSYEKALSSRVGPAARFAYENRNGQVVRQFAGPYAARYHRMLKGMVERRMRQSVFAIASFWYTAWVDAGQPDLSLLVFDHPESFASVDALQDAWMRSNIIGRSCSK